MPSLNQINLIGHTGADPEMKFLPSGLPITTFNLAVNNPKKVNDKWEDNTLWFRITTFKDAAERVNRNISKGALVYVSGPLKLDIWQDQAGNSKYTLEVMANTVKSLSKNETRVSDSTEDEDIPF